MKIVLDQPFSVGDLIVDTYPHVYITTFYSNGPAVTVNVAYEVGKLEDPSEEAPTGTWHKSPYIPTATLDLVGAELVPFFYAEVDNSSDASTHLWDQVTKLIYAQVQKKDPRLAGKLV